MIYKGRQYEMVELRWRMFGGAAAGEMRSREETVGIDGDVCPRDVIAEFEKDGTVTEVYGFELKDGVFAVRFYAEEPGEYAYRVRGAVEESGTVVIEPQGVGGGAVSPRRGRRHGMVRAGGSHFRYADGTWYHPFGTTVYALLHQEDALIEQTMETLRRSPFNKIRFCVFPKHYEYNHNEPEYFAFEKTGGKWDTHRPCFAFWERLESRIREMDERGIECDLILFHPYDRWGFAHLTREEALAYLDYAVRRLSAFPNVWWSLANEYDLMAYTDDDWKCFAHFIRRRDPFGHLLSNHQIVRPWDFANEDTTHICLQLGDVDTVRDFVLKYRKPMMIDECRYEGNVPQPWGNISGFEMVNRFWKVVTQGGYCTHGEAFLEEKAAASHDDDVIWWAKGGVLHGESPARIGFLRDIVESLPTPLTYACRVATVEDIRAFKANAPQNIDPDSFTAAMLRMEDEYAVACANAGCSFLAKCDGDAAFLKYYERQCTVVGELELPGGGERGSAADGEAGRGGVAGGATACGSDSSASGGDAAIAGAAGVAGGVPVCAAAAVPAPAYDVEVIDVWNMTRETVLRGVSGRVCVPLPGREGIALLATKCHEST